MGSRIRIHAPHNATPIRSVVLCGHSRMFIAILHNRDHDCLEEDPGREAREDVTHVAAALCESLNAAGVLADPFPVADDVVGVLESLQHAQPDLVVNLCESIAADSRGEMAMPCMLDLLGVPYTGSGP